MAQQKFIIIDGNALLHRAWHALPPLTTKTGELINAAYGFTLVLMKALKELKPIYGAVAFDRRAKTFRHEIYKEYKATRPKQPEELYNQIPKIKEVLNALGIPIFELDHFEADDLIATICENTPVNRPDVESIIITGDMDTLQLVDENTKVYALKKGVSDIMIYDEKAVMERYGLAPKQLADFKALRGDPSDNIPGARGIGEITAGELIREFGSIEKLYEAIEQKDKKIEKIKNRTLEILKKEKENVFLGKKLVSLIIDAPIDFNLDNCKIKIDKEKLNEIFKKFDFTSLLKKTDELAPISQGKLF